MSLYRIQIVWSGAQVNGNGLSTFYFSDAGGTPSQAVTAVTTFLGATEDRRVIGTRWDFFGDVPVINVTTGALQAINSATAAFGTGTMAGDALPAQNQGLMRLITSTIVNGRLLRGRLFLPAPGEADNGAGGTVSATYTGDYNTAMATLISDPNSVYQIWSHTHGAAGDVTSGSVWTKWAALRSRRD